MSVVPPSRGVPPSSAEGTAQEQTSPQVHSAAEDFARDPPLIPHYSRDTDGHPMIGEALLGTDRIAGDPLRRSLRLVTIAWFYGAFWVAATAGASTTRLAQYLGADDRLFGWLGAAPYIAVLLQIPGSLIVGWLGRRKTFFLWTVTSHRLMFVLIGFLPWLLPAHRALSAILMILLLFVSTGLNNLGTPAWVNWMADLVPPRVRGKYFARRGRLGIVVMMVTSLGMGLMLDAFERPAVLNWATPLARHTGLDPLILLISVVFIVAGFVGMMDILTFRKVEEPRMAPALQESLLARLARPLRDAQFMRYCAYFSVWNFSVAFSGVFWWVYFLKFADDLSAAGSHAWWLNYRYLAAFVILGVSYQIGQFIGYPMWGSAVDKFGRKPVLFISSSLHSLCWFCWIFLSPQTVLWLAPVQMLGGFIGGGQDIANFNMMLGFNRKGGPAYQSLGSVIFSLAGAAACVSAGFLGDALTKHDLSNFTLLGWRFSHYAILIAISIAVKYFADFVMLRLVQDLESKPTRHAVRFVFENMQGNLTSLIFAPLRSLPVGARKQLRSWRRMGERIITLGQDDKPS